MYLSGMALTFSGISAPDFPDQGSPEVLA